MSMLPAHEANRVATSDSEEDSRNLMEQDLRRLYGPVLDSEALWRILCYPTRDAFRQAVKKGVCPVAVFSVAHRRGYFALTKSVAIWLTEASAAGAAASNKPAKPLATSRRESLSPPQTRRIP